MRTAKPHPPTGADGRAPQSGPPVRRETRCPCCGRGAVFPIAQPGRMVRYRNAALTLPADLLVPTCRRCQHRLLSFEAMPELHARLEATYRTELRDRAAVAITRLGRTHSQRSIEVAVDLAQGYLSRLRAKDGVPSAALVSLLALLANEPARLEELQRYWALPVDASPALNEGTVLR